MYSQFFSSSIHPSTKTRSTKDTEEDSHKDDLLLARVPRPTSLLNLMSAVNVQMYHLVLNLVITTVVAST
jgi:hypothetical protein